MSIRPDRQFRFAIAAIKAIGLCPPEMVTAVLLDYIEVSPAINQ